MSAFPPNFPADLDDLAAIAENDWAAFRALRHMDTHWRRPGWTPGRRSYHWMVTFDGGDHGSGDLDGGAGERGDAIGQHVARVQEAVPSAGFDLVPVAGVHLTVGRVGFADELPVQTAMAVGAHAQQAANRPPAFELAFGPLTGSRGAIRFSLGPWTPLVELHRFLAGATRAVLGERCVMDTASFRPHVSIAYAHTRVPVPEVVAALDPVRAVPGPRVVVRWASLVGLERVDRSYRHRTLLRVELPAPGRPGSSATGRICG